MNTWYWLIPSQNIREHLQKIEYKFSALEVAFLLWNNKNITISQKHGYWNTLTKEMPDEEIKRRINTDPYPSLHDYLRAYKETQNALLAEFYDEKNAVYSYRFYCEGDNDWCENYKTVYPTYNAAYSALKEDFDLPIVKVEIKKQRLDEPKRIITVMMTKNGKSTDIDVLGTTKQESDILYGVFEGLWLDIPLPFKRGDILQAKRSYYDYETEDSEPFVLESCHNWTAKDYKANGVQLSRERARNIDWQIYRRKKNGDISDTFPCGYALSDGFVRGANKLYRQVIADGHHRAASAVKAGVKRREAAPAYDGTEEFNYFLSVIFPADSLKIFDYNRLLRDLNGMDAAQFLSAVEKALGKVEEVAGKGPYAPDSVHTVGLYVGKKWYKVSFRAELCEDNSPSNRLDCAILQKYLLAPVLGIADPRTDKRIDFVGGIRGLEYLEKRCEEDAVAAISMYPVSMEELISVADAGGIMPPKSTWFEPKLRSGIFIHKI